MPGPFMRAGLLRQSGSLRLPLICRRRKVRWPKPMRISTGDFLAKNLRKSLNHNDKYKVSNVQASRRFAKCSEMSMFSKARQVAGPLKFGSIESDMPSISTLTSCLGLLLESAEKECSLAQESWSAR